MSSLLMTAPVTISSKKWPMKAANCTLDSGVLFLQEVDQSLQRYPHTQYVDIYLHDLNGYRRGKRIDVACLKSLRTGCYFEPRNILQKLLKQLNQLGYYPCIAVELEFYLQPVKEDAGHSLVFTQCFDIDPPSRDQHVLDDINRMATEQGIHITGMVAESSSGQYEINLQH